MLKLDGGESADAGLAACLRQVKNEFGLKVGMCGTTDASHLNVAASDPRSYAVAVRNFLDSLPFEVDELWTDFEIKGLSAGQTAGTNQMHALMQGIRPTFRYAGCEPRDPPYFSENCSAFVAGAPGVVVQAANTYWSSRVSGGWYEGFGHLLQQEMTDIGPENINVLSPAICPSCPSGDETDDTLTQQQLYERVDMICAAGMTDLSVFTFLEVVQGPHGQKDPQFGRTLSERYFEAFSYFKNGKKGLLATE